MNLSDKGKRLLMEWEGFKTEVYLDSAGLKTVGVGHLLIHDELSLSEVVLDDGQVVKFENGLTEDQVLLLLARDVRKFEQVIQDVKVELKQNEFDALVIFAFNIGIHAFIRSTLLEKLNTGDYKSVPSELRRWNRAGGQVVKGLSNRREKEIALWSGAI